MRYELEIDYSLEEMEASRLRMEARLRFKIMDRVPVNYCVVPRYFAPIFNLPYLDFFADVETQYYWLLQFAKFQIENIPCDACTSPVIYVHPYFDNVVPPSAHGAEIGWTPDSPPRAIPVLDTLEKMEHYRPPATDAGLRGKVIEWWLVMRELASQTRVSFKGVPGRVDVAPLGCNYLSPHMIAVDLVGTDFYWWILDYPEACHRFLTAIAESEIEAEELVRKIDPRPRGELYGVAEDSAQILSPRQFVEFCIPYSGMMFERFGTNLKFGRGIHMCGDSSHLLPSLKNELRMTHFDVFGYLVPPKVAAEKLGGNILMWGNLNPMLMRDGSSEEVRQAAWECLKALVPCGGFMLGDGANICPGTPLENFQAVMEAAKAYGTGKDIEPWKQ